MQGTKPTSKNRSSHKEIRNKGRYITTETLSQCFDIGKHNYVDKGICGNGYSTAFLNHIPPRGKSNIMIVPNLAVLKAKENEYVKGELSNGMKMAFIYKKSDLRDWRNADIIVFVADSFLLLLDKLLVLKRYWYWILIDEFHSMEIQSSFRNNLTDFDSKIFGLLENSGITSVSATPNMGSPVNIKIINEVIKPTIIHLSNSPVNGIKRVKESLKTTKVVVFTNDYRVLRGLEKRNGILEANFIIGESMKESLMERCEYRDNPSSNLIICSSTGFEGHDIFGKGYHAYFFEDRRLSHTTFYISNLIQALNRTRTGAVHMEYNRVDLGKGRNEEPSESELLKFVNDGSIMNASKQKMKYRHYHKFLVFDFDEVNGNFDIKLNRVSVELHNEKLLYDNGFTDFQDYLNERKITIREIKEPRTFLKATKTRESKAKEMLSRNAKYISIEGLFGRDYKMRRLPLGSPYESYLKAYQKYKRRINFSGEDNQTDRNKQALEIFYDKNILDVITTRLRKDHDERVRKDYPEKRARNKIADFKKLVESHTLDITLSFANENITFQSKMIGHRDYNSLYPIRPKTLGILSKYFGIKIESYDIRNCFPRIIYALNGLELPNNFYGINKENKRDINVFLNDFFYDSDKLSSKKVQKYRAINKMNDYRFNPKVIDYLITEWFQTEYRGKLFNYLSFHERLIIDNLKKELKSDENDGVCRRHDEIVTFNNKQNMKFLCDFNYLGQKGWF